MKTQSKIQQAQKSLEDDVNTADGLTALAISAGTIAVGAATGGVATVIGLFSAFAATCFHIGNAEGERSKIFVML